MVVFIQVKPWNFPKNIISKLVNSMKIGFLFVGLNLNFKEAPDKCTFYG